MAESHVIYTVWETGVKMSILYRIGRKLWPWIGVKQIVIGKSNYARYRFFPNMLASANQYERWIDDIYENILNQKKGAVLDVGVNIGQSLLKILGIDPNREYVGFEPQVGASFAVEQFLIENGLSNHIILPIALSNNRGIVKLKTRGHGFGSLYSSVASIIDNFRPDDFYDYDKYIYTVPGDEIIPNLKLQSVAMIKIDVEGAELEVIEGLESTIDIYMLFILFEVLHHYLVVTSEELDEELISFREARIAKIEKILRTKRYEIFQICGEREIRKVEKIKPKKIGDFRTTDYLAVPYLEEADFVKRIQKDRRLTM